MSEASLLILALVLQQVLFALGWWVSAAHLRMSRGASAHWAGFCAGTAAAMLMFMPLVREAMGPIAVVLRNALVVLSFVLLRRGLRVFLNRPRRDAEQWGLFAVFSLAMLPLGTDATWIVERTVGVSLALAVLLLRGGWEVARDGRAEFGPYPVAVVAVPMVTVGALMVARSVMAVAQPQSSAVSVTAAGQFNGLLLLVLVGLITLFHFALGYLVILRLIGKLQHLSRHDALTGLLNRRALQERLAQEVAASRRQAQPLGLLMVDLDHFKRVNDLHGHPVGDAALQWVAQRLAAAARASDVVARLGGEEFCVLLPATDAAGIRQAAERLRLEVARQTFTLQDPAGQAPVRLDLSVSVGASMLLAGEADGGHLMRRADQALYRAKAEGRNRVVFDALAGVAAPASQASA